MSAAATTHPRLALDSVSKRIGRWAPCTTSRPFAFSCSRLPASAKFVFGMYIAYLPQMTLLGRLREAPRPFRPTIVERQDAGLRAGRVQRAGGDGSRSPSEIKNSSREVGHHEPHRFDVPMQEAAFKWLQRHLRATGAANMARLSPR
jgi:hypothetical protein